MLGSGHKEYSKFLSIEVIDSVDIECWGRVSLPEFDFSEEDFTSLSPKVQTNYTIRNQYAYNL